MLSLKISQGTQFKLGFGKRARGTKSFTRTPCASNKNMFSSEPFSSDLGLSLNCSDSTQIKLAWCGLLSTDTQTLLSPWETATNFWVNKPLESLGLQSSWDESISLFQHKTFFHLPIHQSWCVWKCESCERLMETFKWRAACCQFANVSKVLRYCNKSVSKQSFVFISEKFLIWYYTNPLRFMQKNWEGKWVEQDRVRQRLDTERKKSWMSSF